MMPEPASYFPKPLFKRCSIVMQVRSGDGIAYLNLDLDAYSCRYDPIEPINAYFFVTDSVSGCDRAESRETPNRRWRDPHPIDDLRPTVADLRRFFVALIKATSQFYGKRVFDLCNVLRELEHAPLRKHANIYQAATIFRQLVAFMPFRPQCLFVSFLFLHFLGLYGLRATWVFGVQLFPFRAHCWVAHGDELLNEVAHNVESYEIIYMAGQDRQ